MAESEHPATYLVLSSSLLVSHTKELGFRLCALKNTKTSPLFLISDTMYSFLKKKKKKDIFGKLSEQDKVCEDALSQQDPAAPVSYGHCAKAGKPGLRNL